MNVARRLFALALGRRAAVTRGSCSVRGVEGRVRIRRDAWGIPYVTAESDHDAWFGFGFAQAQDRAFQVELFVRSAHGTLCELVGPEMLAADRLARRVGFREIAARQYAVLTPRVRAQFEAFAAGWNAGIAHGLTARPHEFALLSAEPRRFEPEDVLAIVAFLGFALASNWDIELARYRTWLSDGANAVRDIDAAYPSWLPVVEQPLAASFASAARSAERLAEDLRKLHEITGSGGGGSNAWVIASSRTSTGRPILANDPHLPPILPAHWYIAHISTPRWSTTGMSFAGLPGQSAGHNGHCAWGVTAGHHDITDLFIEQMGSDGTSVRDGDGFVPCVVREERIRVKGSHDVVERVVETPRGPIISPALGDEVGALSLRGTWMAPRPIDGLFGFHLVRSFDDFRETNRSCPCVSTMYVYADTKNTIGWNLVGDTPIRKSSDNLLPLPGWDRSVGWTDQIVPFDQMPHGTNPPHGFAASSNNAPQVDGDGPYLGVDFPDGYRHARVCERLAERSDWTLDATLSLMRDTLSIPWREIRDIVLATPPTTVDNRLAHTLLSSWNGRVSHDSAAASVFEFFVAEMIHRTVRRRAPRSAEWALGRGINALFPHSLMHVRRLSHLTALLREQPAGWFPEGWAHVIADALGTAVRQLRRRRGPAVNNWEWGHVRTLTFKHPVGEKPPLGDVFNLGPVPAEGDSSTIPQHAVDWFSPDGNPIGVPNLRLVFDVGHWDAARIVLAGGQSGNPVSPHYDDLFSVWARGDTVPLPSSERGIAEAAVDELVLERWGRS